MGIIFLILGILFFDYGAIMGYKIVGEYPKVGLTVLTIYNFIGSILILNSFRIIKW